MTIKTLNLYLQITKEALPEIETLLKMKFIITKLSQKILIALQLNQTPLN